MTDSIHATCPGCSTVLRIPASWAGRSFKCKKCGAVMKAKAGGPASSAPEQPAPAEPAPQDFALPNMPSHDFALPPETPAAPPAPAPAYGYPQQPGYGVPPGYPQQQPGYPYPQQHQPQPGYPYPQPGYGAPPGYPQPAPGGYPGAPAGYNPQPGYAPPGYAPPAYAPPNYPQPAPYGPPPVPQYGAPPAPAPAPAPIQNAFADAKAAVEKQDSKQRGKKRKYKKGSDKSKFIMLGVAALVLLVGGVGMAKFVMPMFAKAREKKEKEEPGKGTPSTAPGTNPSISRPPISAATGPAPRRILMLNTTNYLFCNPLANGVGFKRTQLSEVANSLKVRWRIPTEKTNNQVFILTDVSGISGDSFRPMLKPIINDAVTEFCTTSRPQDRLLIYFGGHATMIDEKAYLVPAEGDFAEAETLIPLADFYAKIAASPAQQKVVIFDVCRMNVDGDRQRPAGTEAMTEELEKALHTPPAGVQVVTSCSAGENAVEIRTPLVFDSLSKDADLKGSLCLTLLKRALDSGKVKGDKLTPEEAFPVKDWVDVATAASKQVFTDRPELLDVFNKKAPTMKMSGDVGTPIQYVSAEAPASRFDFKPPPPKFEGPEIKLADELLGLPPIRPQNENDTKPESLTELSYFFTAETMKDYKTDMTPEMALKMEDKYPLRALAVKALQLIQVKWGGEARIITQFSGETTGAVKEGIKKQQGPLSSLTIDLDEVMLDMTAMLPMLEKEESKFWRATFKFAYAQIKLRYAFSQEANLALGMILTESLPEQLDKAKGFQLVSTEKMKSKKDERKVADEGREILDELVKETKGTPWEVAAKRSRSAALGLEWRPYLPSTDKDEMEMKKE